MVIKSNVLHNLKKYYSYHEKQLNCFYSNVVYVKTVCYKTKDKIVNTI